MTLRLAILCSGQGAQHAGMFALARTDRVAASLLDTWLPAAGSSAQADLFANCHAQPALVAAACATWTAVRPYLPTPVAVAGYSVGEIAALAVSGVLDAGDAVTLARARARLMDACVDPAQPQGLLAVSGLSMAALKAVLAQQSATDTQVAIINGPDQTILGGRRRDGAAGPGLESLAQAFQKAGAQATLLPVAIASHTLFMQAAVVPLQAHLEALQCRAPQVRLLAGVDGAASATAESAVAALVRQTVQTVRWDNCMDALAEAGVTTALELGPGSALCRMLIARHPGIACRSVAEFRSLEGIQAWIARR
jgi:[acyl-carrier-protein] S-malonyltransferase